MKSPFENTRIVFAIAIALALPALAGCAAPEGGGDGGDGDGGTAATIKTTCGGAADRALTGSSLSDPSSVTMSVQEAVFQNAAAFDAQQQGGEPLVIGTLLPLTGDLQVFGASMERATDLAVEQINAAGGVNGQPVEVVHEDSRTDATQAPNAFNNLVNEGVAGVVGAASSGITASILDLAVDNGVVVVTPASTSPTLTTERDNQGWFYRVPPSDALQGTVLADLVYDDGCMSAAIIAVNNPYGVGLGNVFQSTFEDLGGQVTEFVKFEPQETTFSSTVQQAGAGNPDALVFVGYPETGSQIVKEAYEKGLLANSVLFFSEGVKDPQFVETVGKTADDAWILAGLKGTTPASVEGDATQQFLDAYTAEYGEEPGLFAAESYDGVFALALAAQKAGENTGEGVKANIRDVWNSPGVEFNGGQAAAAFTAATAGQDVDYVGASGNFDWDENGDPTSGIYSVWTVTSDGEIDVVEENIQP